MPTESSPAVLAVPAVHIVSPDEAHMVTGHGVGSLVPLMVSWKIAARFVACSCWFIVVSFQRPLRGVRSLFWVGGMWFFCSLRFSLSRVLNRSSSAFFDRIGFGF